MRQKYVAPSSHQLVLYKLLKLAPAEYATARPVKKCNAHRNFKIATICALSLSSLSVAVSTASAQSTPGADAGIQELMVTGSRIQRSGMTTPTPVTAVTMDELDLLAPTTMMDALNQMPQFLNSDTPESVGGWTGSAGQSILNLRGVGAPRTLVLLDGRRVVASTRRGSPDINTFPAALVQRVDVVTGGASAAYGSDAVSGVVNFVLDKDFTGLKGHAQGGMTSRSDQENFELSLSGGFSLGERTHLLLSGDYFQSEEITDYHDRSWAQESWGVITNPSGTPQRVMVPNVHATNQSPGGLITGGPLAGTQFLSDGTPAAFVPGDYATSATQSGGSGWDSSLDDTLSPGQKRGSGFAYLSYDLNDRTKLYLQGMYGVNQVEYDKPGVQLLGPWQARIYSDNAYLPESLRQRMIEEGIDSFPFASYRPRDELSIARVDTENQTYSLTAGADIDLGNWQLNTYYQYGRNKQVLTMSNVARIDRLFRALDAVLDPQTGQIVCNSTLSNPNDACVPINLFGRHSATPEATDYVLGRYATPGSIQMDSKDQVQILEQHVFEITLSGEAFDNWAGPVGVATGLAYRYDALDQQAYPKNTNSGDPGCTPTAESVGYRGLPQAFSGCYGLFERGTMPSVEGTADVWEVFAEGNMPLLRDSMVGNMDLLAAARFAEYEGSGGIWAWKGGLDWQLTDTLRFRMTQSRDVRAGTLAERYDIASRGASAEDPFVDLLEPYSFTQIEGGNPNINPEEADTLTVGAVYQPAWLDGFNISADYYDIKIKDAISSLGPQQIIDQCFAGAQNLCERIRRNPDTGLIDQLVNTYLNVAEARTRGMDIEATYSLPITLFGGDENLSLRAIATRTFEASTTNPGAATEDRAGQTGTAGGGGAPKWQLNFNASYTRGPFVASWQQRYIDSGTYNAIWLEGVDIDNNKINARHYSNLRLSYDLDRRGGTYELFAHISNLFDNEPPKPHVNPGLYSEIGRRYTVGVRMTY